jgi:hypothetical protein
LTKARHVAASETEQVVPDEYLTVARWSGADTNRRDLQRIGDSRRNRRRNRFEHDSKAAGAFECARFIEDPARICRRAPRAL